MRRRNVYGYVRVSTAGQMDGNSPEEQRNKILEAYPDAEIVEEAYSGAKERPKFLALLEKLETGDILVTTKLDRFCRTTKEGLGYIDDLRDKGVKIHILNMGLVENTDMGRMMVTMLLAFAEFERAQIVERTQSGKAIARQQEGFREGRPAKEVPNLDKYVNKVQDGILSVAQVCAELNISRSTWYRLQKRAL